MELTYLKAVLVVWAGLGLQLVEPFYARTIQEGATHSSLKTYYSIHSSMGKPVKEEFFTFIHPQLEGVSEELFKAVKESYETEVVEAVKDMGEQHKKEVMSVTSLTMKELQTVLARQRRDYGINEEAFPPQYPVEQQADKVDQTPVHNIAMERMCGKVDYRLKRLGTLESVSRSIILQKSQELRDNKPTIFSGFKKELEAVKELKLAWSKRMKDKQKKGSDEKQEVAKKKEEKRLDTLDYLKSKGGPFTDAGEVDQYLSREEVDKKE
jgi:hypothetical protein